MIAFLDSQEKVKPGPLGLRRALHERPVRRHGRGAHIRG